MRFDGQVLFATGGGSGLGAAVARRFAAEGGRVALADLDADKAAEVAAGLPGALAMGCDVADEDAVADAVGRSAAEFGRLDCVFNAAGHVQMGPIVDWSFADWQRLLSVHVGGTFLVCKYAIPHLSAEGGAIVNVSSIASLTAQPNNSPYGAAKGAIASFSRQLARDLAPAIRVNAVLPGRIRTGMTIPLLTKRGDGDYEKGTAVAAQMNLLQRIAEPEEVAGPVCFLFSKDASFITGASLVIDGGETIL